MFIRVSLTGQTTTKDQWELPPGVIHRTLVGVYVNEDVEDNLLPNPILLQKDRLFSIFLGRVRFLTNGENILVEVDEKISEWKHISIANFPAEQLKPLDEKILEAKSLLIQIEDVYDGYHDEIAEEVAVYGKDLKTFSERSGWVLDNLSAETLDCMTCQASQGYRPYSPIPLQIGPELTYVTDMMHQVKGTISIEHAMLFLANPDRNKDPLKIKPLQTVYPREEEFQFAGEIEWIVLDQVIGLDGVDKFGLAIELNEVQTGKLYEGYIQGGKDKSGEEITSTFTFNLETAEMDIEGVPYVGSFRLITRGHIHEKKHSLPGLPDNIRYGITKTMDAKYDRWPVAPEHIVQMLDHQIKEGSFRLLPIVEWLMESKQAAPLITGTLVKYLEENKPNWKDSYPETYKQLYVREIPDAKLFETPDEPDLLLEEEQGVQHQGPEV